MWLSDRAYPTIPVWSGLPPVPWPADVIWFASLGLLLMLALVEELRRPCIGLFLLLLAPLLLWDQSRWQVPVYQYVLLLVTLRTTHASQENVPVTAALGTARIIVASIYFWSGVQKINATFVRRVFPWMLSPVIAAWPGALRLLVPYLAMLVPPLEVGIAVGLLSRRFRTVAVWLAVAMHAAILVLLGPLGHRWDPFVWPWNVAMASFVVILYAGAPELRFSALREVLRSTSGAIVTILVAVMPAFSFVGWWDMYLSWSAYSGTIPEATLRLSDAALRDLPDRVRSLVNRRPSGDYRLDVMRWSFHELGVESYPEARVYKRVARWVCAQTGDPAGVQLIIWERPPLLDDRRSSTTYSCGEL